jgi:uncharacterized membrane protein
MTKQQYLDALKQAMQGLPPETVAKTLAYYEQRFIDGLVAGAARPRSTRSSTSRARSP